MRKFKNHKNNSNYENALQQKNNYHLYYIILFVTIHFLGTLCHFQALLGSQPQQHPLRAPTILIIAMWNF
jgi:hypothetical protein